MNYDNIGTVFKVAFTKDGSVSVSLFLGALLPLKSEGYVHDLRHNQPVTQDDIPCDNRSCDYSVMLDIGRIIKVLLKGSLVFEVSL